jgi:putative lipoic acid-binding regulatory protein
MANGDITKEIEYDKIEVVNTWAIQVRKATKIMEEGSGGAKTELSRSFQRHVLQPFNSVKAEDDSWTHTATDISGEHASVQAIANAAWTDDVKAAYKAMREAQGV